MARKKTTVGDWDEFKRQIESTTREIACKPGPTFKERLGRLEATRRQFFDTAIDDTKTRMLALGMWHGYPVHYWGCVALEKFEPWQREMLLDSVNATHEAAVQFLMRLAAKHISDAGAAGALWEAGRLCRELFTHPELWNVDQESRSCPSWPDCLGRKRYALSQEECIVIREGEKVFRALLIRPKVARDALKVESDQGRDQVLDDEPETPIPADLLKWIGRLPPDETPGLREAYRRDHLWLTWNRSKDRFGPARIRDRWNTMPEAQRKLVSPRLPGKVGSGSSGAATVKEGIKKARREQTARKSKTSRKAAGKTRSRNKT